MKLLCHAGKYARRLLRILRSFYSCLIMYTVTKHGSVCSQMALYCSSPVQWVHRFHGVGRIALKALESWWDSGEEASLCP